MQDDAMVKIISSLGVDYSQAIASTKIFAAEIEKLNTKLGMLKVTAADLGRAAGTSMAQQAASGKVIIDQYSNVLSTITTQTKTLEKSGKITEAQLAAIEKRLVATAATAQKLGVSIPGIEGRIGEVRGYRDMLQQQQSLTKEQLKSVAAIKDYSVIQAENIATLQKEIDIQTKLVKGEEMLGDAASRRQMAELRGQQAINKEWDEYLAKLALADDKLKQQQMGAMWATYEKDAAARTKTAAARTGEEIKAYEAMLRQQEAAALLLPTIEAQVAAIQSKIKAQGIDNEQLKEQSALLRSQIAALQSRLAVEGKLTEAEIAQTNELRKQAAILDKNVRTAVFDTVDSAANKHKKTVEDLNDQYSVLGSQFERRASWFFAGSAFFGSMAALGTAVKTIADVEMGMTQIARVMEDSAFVFKDYRDELLKLGVQYGQTFATVQDVALRFAQAGYGVKDSLELTETALMALRSAELDAKNATESMIGIMAQWGLQAKDMPLLLDILNKTADDYTVTTQDLVDALLRSSGAAKIMGLSIQETIALLTVMREASGRTGKEVGKRIAA